MAHIFVAFCGLQEARASDVAAGNGQPSEAQTSRAAFCGCLHQHPRALDVLEREGLYGGAAKLQQHAARFGDRTEARGILAVDGEQFLGKMMSKRQGGFGSTTEQASDALTTWKFKSALGGITSPAPDSPYPKSEVIWTSGKVVVVEMSVPQAPGHEAYHPP